MIRRGDDTLRLRLLAVVVVFSHLLPLTSHLCIAGNLLTERYNLTYLDLSNGLPHNHVSDIFKDSSGFLWISTYGGGLVRYDGYGVMEPRLDLNSKSCRSITEDNFHRLWVAFDEGINIIDLKTMKAVTPVHPELQKLLVLPSIRCYQDALGRIWVITDRQVSLVTFDSQGQTKQIYNYPHRWRMLDIAICDVEENGKPWIGIDGGLYRLVEKGGKLVREEISALLKPLQDHYITDILKRNNVVWITTNMGLFRYDPYQQKLSEYHHAVAPADVPTHSLSHTFLSSLAVTSDNRLLVGSLCGVNIYDDASDSFTAWTSESSVPLRSDFVDCIRVYQGHIWIGTESGGIACLAPQRLLLRNSVHTSDPHSLSPNPVNAMLAEPDGRLWVGTVEGGLNLREKDTSGFIHFTTANSGLSHNSVSALAADHHGRLWIGTWGGGVCQTDRQGAHHIARLELPEEYRLRTPFVGALAVDTINDGLWIGSNAGLFYYDFKTRRIEDPFEGCRNITGNIGAIVDRKGFLWMGCMQGVIRVDLHSGLQGRRPFKYEAISHKLDEPGSRIVDKISSFCQTRDGTLWLGSNGYGLYRLVRRQESGGRSQEVFEALTTEDGLAFGGVKGIVEDANGRLWVTTQNGLSIYDPKTRIFSNYFESEGLVNHHFYWNSAVRDESGVICLGSEGGLIEVLGENAEAQPYGRLVFTRLMVDNQEVAAGSEYLSDDISIATSIQLRESNRSFSIAFSALDYGNEAQAMFSYRMKGLEDEWTPLKLGEHSVRYSALPAGHYTFEVRYVSSFSAAQSDIASIDVVVNPAFWNSWWFRLLLSVLLVLLILYIYNRWAARLKRIEAEQLLNPIRKVLEESDDPRQLQGRIQNILDNQQRYKQSVNKSVEADKEEVLKTTRPLMERVMELMEQNYMNSEFGVQEFCDALGMSRSVASKHLNAEAGLPVGQFIRNYRLNMAKELLSQKTGNRNITEIAYKVGFNDPKYFTRCFTKMFGVSPSHAAYLPSIALIVLGLCTSCQARQTANELVPSEPDYQDSTQWYITDRQAAADVFYVISTETGDYTMPSGETCHYADTYSDSLRAPLYGEMLGVDTLVSGRLNYYSPYYRQCSLQSFESDSLKAVRMPLALGDVQRAFKYYLKHYNQGRPFILAGFSQGAHIMLELLKDMDDDTFQRLIAAYAIGITIPEADPHIIAAKRADDTGVTICYNSVRDTTCTMRGWTKSSIAINPVNWRTDSTPATLITEPSPLLPVDKQKKDTMTIHLNTASGLLIVEGFTAQDYVLPLLGQEGNYHTREIWLYRDQLRENMSLRAAKYLD